MVSAVLSAQTWLNCSLCRSQPPTLPCMWHLGHPLPDEGSRTGHGDTTHLAPWTFHSCHIFQLGGRRSALFGAESDYYHPLQSTTPLCTSLPRKEMWQNSKENVSKDLPLLVNLQLHKLRDLRDTWTRVHYGWYKKCKEHFWAKKSKLDFLMSYRLLSALQSWWYLSIRHHCDGCYWMWWWTENKGISCTIIRKRLYIMYLPKCFWGNLFQYKATNVADQLHY